MKANCKVCSQNRKFDRGNTIYIYIYFGIQNLKKKVIIMLYLVLIIILNLNTKQVFDNKNELHLFYEK